MNSYIEFKLHVQHLQCMYLVKVMVVHDLAVYLSQLYFSCTCDMEQHYITCDICLLPSIEDSVNALIHVPYSLLISYTVFISLLKQFNLYYNYISLIILITHIIYEDYSCHTSKRYIIIWGVIQRPTIRSLFINVPLDYTYITISRIK